MKNALTVLSLFCLSITAASASDLFDNYSFDNAAQAHRQAVSMSAQNGFNVVGNWTMIATSSSSYKGVFAKKDPNGIANQDSSTLQLQIIAQSVGSLLQVKQLNLGIAGRDQGPSVVTYNGQGTMSWAQFSYKNGAVTDDVFFNSECKQLFDGSLLCAKRFMVQNASELNAQQRAMDNTIVGYDLYVRSN